MPSKTPNKKSRKMLGKMSGKGSGKMSGEMSSEKSSEKSDRIPDYQTDSVVPRELLTMLNRFILPNEIRIEALVGSGGFTDIYIADMRIAETDVATRVAVKRHRVVLRTAEEFAKV
jgi:hypothetical protein